MALGYHINPDEGLITVHGGGDVVLQELARLGASLLEDPRYDPELPQLLDFRGLRQPKDAPQADEREIEALKDFVRETYRERVKANVAVVIDEHLEDQHCADIYLLTCALREAELFADYDQALKWLIREAFVPGPTPTEPAATSAEQQDTGADQAHGAPE
ncbi:MAG: hypothetical protein RIC56_18675 [Pseudomonadales bacterium]